MKSSDWRHYRGYLIVKSRGFLGLTRFEVWNGSDLIGSFATVVRAELHVDGLLRQRNESSKVAAGSGT